MNSPLLHLLVCAFVLSPVGARAATYLVINTANSGVGSLRQAILDANSNAGPDIINFRIGGAPPYIITPTTPLPSITGAVVIDGTSQTNFAGLPLIVLNGSSAGADADGLVLLVGSCTVRGLVINRFAGYGMSIEGSGNNVIQGNFIGTDNTGAISQPNGEAGIGLFAPNNVIGGTDSGARNLISGKNRAGIFINGNSASGNQILGNFIGTDRAGQAALGSLSNGVLIVDAPRNTIGGTSLAARNLISGNGQSGVYLDGAAAVGNVIQGNFIGTDVTGTHKLANASDGVTVFSAPSNTIGGAVAGARNLISGNGEYGVLIDGSAAVGNQVQANFIGTDLSGAVDLGNGFSGVGLGAAGNLIGGTTATARNIISGNDASGVFIFDSGTSNNLVQGNFIGTDVTGSVALHNNFDGVTLSLAHANTIGGLAEGAGNVISGNSLFGIFITNNLPPGNIIQGNFIGTDATGHGKLGNQSSGIGIYNGPGNTIGGSSRTARNLISANQQLGIYLNHSATNLIQGNFVGTGSSGTESLGNSLDGMIISDSPDNLIGGTAPGTRNLIANNGYGSTDGGSGIYLFGPASMRNQILGNVIGTDISGTIMLSNSRDGVTIFAGSANVVGGPALGAGNLLSGNADTGVYILGDTASANKVQGNFIGTRPDGITRLDHRLHGVQIDTGAFNNIIGGLGQNEGNIIAYNRESGYDGVRIRAGTGNLVAGNSIFGHAGLGIDLGTDGVTANDTRDVDNGANNLQNFPVLTSASNSGGNTTVVQGTFNSERTKSYRIDFYATATCNASGYGEGQTPIGSTTVTTDSNGNATFAATLPVAVPAGHVTTATATDPQNNTSEFSLCQTVTGNSISADLSIAQTFPASGQVGQTLTLQLVLANNSSSAAYNVRLIDTLPGSVTYLSANPTPTSLFLNTLIFNLGTVPGNSTVSVSINVVPTAAGGITNSIQVVSAVPDPNLANNSASATATITGGGGVPELQIVRSSSQVTISWPNLSTEYQLEQASALTLSTTWTSVTTTPQLVNGRNVVRLDISGTARFFRLRRR